jgi:hypothetical protein
MTQNLDNPSLRVLVLLTVTVKLDDNLVAVNSIKGLLSRNIYVFVELAYIRLNETKVA